VKKESGELLEFYEKPETPKGTIDKNGNVLSMQVFTFSKKHL
jgi:ADP-glucose pyrophosphorylase